jgi:hypothetical protein
MSEAEAKQRVEREGRKQYLGLRDAAYVKYARKSVGYEPIILSSVVFRRSDSATRARTDRIQFGSLWRA